MRASTLPTTKIPSHPTGPLGIWYGQDFQQSPRPWIRNRVASSSSVNVNLASAPRRQFGNAYYYIQNGTVIVDSNATAPDGSGDATSLTTTTVKAWNVQVNPLSITLPSGTYTCAISVRWKGTTGDPTFRFGAGTVTTEAGMGAGTATTSWQRFTQTFTVNGATAKWFIPLLNPASGNTQANFEICDWGVYLGSSDLGPDILDGHMLFDKGLSQATIATANGDVKFNGAVGAAVQFPTTSAFNPFTIIYLTMNSGSPTAAAFNCIVSALNGSTWVSFGVGSALNVFQGMQWNGALKTLLTGSGYNIEATSDYTCVAVSYNLTTAKVYVNGVLMHTNTTALGASLNIKEFWAGMLQATDFSNYQLAALGIWPRELSATEVQNATKSFIRDTNKKPPNSTFVLFDGDSITNGAAINGDAGYAYQSFLSFNKVCHGPNFSVPGQNTTQLLARINVDIAAVRNAVQSGQKAVAHLLMGINDLAQPQTPAFVLANIQTWYNAMAKAGATPIIGTLMPCTSFTVNAGANTANQMRNALNTLIYNWANTTPGVILADYAAHAIMGVDAAASNATLYAANIHPTAFGTTLLVPICAATINSVI